MSVLMMESIRCYISGQCFWAVSYTHLDVYKRQVASYDLGKGIWKWPLDKYNSGYHWHFGYHPDTLDLAQNNNVTYYHFMEPKKYFLEVINKDGRINEDSLCSIFFYYEYNYWEGTKRL